MWTSRRTLTRVSLLAVVAAIVGLLGSSAHAQTAFPQGWRTLKPQPLWLSSDLLLGVHVGESPRRGAYLVISDPFDRGTLEAAWSAALGQLLGGAHIRQDLGTTQDPRGARRTAMLEGQIAGSDGRRRRALGEVQIVAAPDGSMFLAGFLNTQDGSEPPGVYEAAAQWVAAAMPAPAPHRAGPREPQPQAPVPNGPVERLELGNTAAVASGPRQPTVITVRQPILVHRLSTYHWNGGRGQRPGSIALADASGTVLGRWQARGSPGQGGVRDAYWVADVGLRLEPGAYTLSTSSNESWATNEGVGWRGFYRMDYQMLAAPAPSQASSPTGPQASASVPVRAPEPAPVAPAEARDPSYPLRPGETRDSVLFEGREGAPWTGYQGQGGNYKEHVRYEGGALVASVPTRSGGGFVGIYSEAPLVWLDALSGGGEAALTFTFDPARTTGFLIGLSPYFNLNGNDPDSPRALLHWRRSEDGAAKVSLIRDDKAVVERVVAAEAPGTVRLVLTEGALRVEGAGLPADPVPWPELVPSLGLRVYAMTRPDKRDQAVSMALRRIALSRRGGAPPPSPLPSAPGVAPLPRAVLFDGRPGEAWKTASFSNGQQARFVAFRGGALVADVPEKQNAWAMAGLLSNEPAVRLDERLDKTTFRMTFTVDPRATTGLQIMFHPERVQDMWGPSMSAAFSLVRLTEGPLAGRHQLTLRTNDRPYSVWQRSVSSAFLDQKWDGRIDLVFGRGWVRTELPGIVALRGLGFNLAPGMQRYASIYSAPEKEYGASRLVLKAIATGYDTPPGMTRAERWTLVDDRAFDAGGFLDDLAKDLEAPALPRNNKP